MMRHKLFLWIHLVFINLKSINEERAAETQRKKLSITR